MLERNLKNVFFNNGIEAGIITGKSNYQNKTTDFVVKLIAFGKTF